ncbi:MAG TPA: alkaline phosphatase family protein [Polyangia bacterium]
MAGRKYEVSRRQALGQIGVGLGAGLTAGLLPGCGLGPTVCGAPPPEAVPGSERDAQARALLSNIDTFVVVMLENRSFDHLLGGLRLDRDYPSFKRITGLTGEEFNLDSTGRLVPIARMPGDGRGTFNPGHDWRSVRATFNEGRNDRFLTVNEDRREVMSYLARDQVPVFHALADRYTVFDHWYASYMGQTWPNRYYLHATTSGGRRENRPFDLDAPIGIWERMAERCLSARNYAAGSVLWYSVAFPARLWTGESAMVPGTIEDFFRDARAGNLPNFSLIDPDFKVNDGYPMYSLLPCQAFVTSIVKAMAESPQWSRSLLLITFDEHGGYYDHIVPPQTTDLRTDFRQLGFRVPAIAIGPTVRQSAVVSTPLEHVSVAATLRARFGIETLSERMDKTLDISDCIDPALIDNPTPPPRDLEPVSFTSHLIAELPHQRSSQPEIEAALAARRLPDGTVDPRSTEERLQSWLRWAQELEAVKVRG